MNNTIKKKLNLLPLYSLTLNILHLDFNISIYHRHVAATKNIQFGVKTLSLETNLVHLRESQSLTFDLSVYTGNIL